MVDFTEDEWKNLQQGCHRRGLARLTPHRDFTDTFGEASAVAKQLAAHRESDSQLVRDLSGTHGTGFGLVASPKSLTHGGDDERSTVRRWQCSAPSSWTNLTPTVAWRSTSQRR